jgi:HK97 family phage portal protein
MTAYTFKERLLADVLLRGNAFAEIEWSREGIPVALWPLPPARTEPKTLDSGRLVYEVKIQESTYQLHPQQVLHVPCMGDGIKGRSLISYAAESIGNALATNEYANRFFSNDGAPGGVLEHSGTLREETQKRLRHSWQAAHGGLSNSHRLAILEEGMTFKSTGVSPEEAQALEARKFNVADIARVFLIPPHMIGDVERSTSWGSGIEQQAIGYLVYALRPWLVRFEQELTYKLFSREERRQFFVENDVDSLLRGDTKTRNEAYAIMRNNGIINADEWREKENLNPLPRGKGKAYLVPLNMGVAGKGGKVHAPKKGLDNE